MTKNKVLLSAFILFLRVLPAFGLDTDSIAGLRGETVSQKTPFSPAQVQIIEKFWRNAIDSLLIAEDSEQQSQIIDQLVAEKGNENLSFYVSSYIETGKKHLQMAFDTVKQRDLPARKLSMERKLMVLIARLKNVSLAPFALDHFKDPDPAVRYWAVKTFDDFEMVRQLADVTSDADLKNKIIQAMSERVENETSFVILRVAVDFAVTLNDAASRDLLNKLAEKRIKAYMDWSVTGEWFDTYLLNGIGQLIVSQQPSDERVKLSRTFAQLYSCVIQRYIKGESLTDSARNSLITVIAEVEIVTVAKLIPGWQMSLKKAVEQNTGLEREAENLLGAPSKPGDLSLRLNFNYGKDPDGKAIMAPTPIQPAPELVKNASAGAAAQ